MNNTPKHIAFIMDGNRRWAKERGLTTKDGHETGFQKLIDMVEACAKRGIDVVTVYALSTENIKKRSKSEIATLFTLITTELIRSRKRLREQGVRLSILGRLKQLPKEVQDVCVDAMQDLKDQTRIKCNIMLNYGGRDELVQAVQQIVAAGTDIKEINEELISEHLYTKGMPDPDLIIRTGGDMRLSNFLIWQMSYSELAFTSTLWPDMNDVELDRILDEYGGRERRLGGDSTQPALTVSAE